MATPRVFGQELRLTANLCLAREASVIESVLHSFPHRLAKRTQERLVCPSTTSNDTNHTTNAALDNLLRAGWELDSGLALIWVVADDGNVVAGGTAERTTVTHLLLDVGDDGTFWDGAEGKDVADGQAGVLAGVDELASVHALVGDEGLGVELEAVWVTENDLGERRTTAWVVDNLLHDTADVSMSLGEVVAAELGGSLVETGVGLRDYLSIAVAVVCEFRIAAEGSRTVKIEPRPFLWLRMTRPCALQSVCCVWSSRAIDVLLTILTAVR